MRIPGFSTAKEKVEEAAQTVTSAMIIAIAGLILAIVAVFVAVGSYAR
jgi:hypothetical protein